MKGLIAILLVFIFIPSCKDLQSNDLPFDSERWKAGDVRLRGRMQRSLYRSRNELLIGKTQLEVKELLGEPGLIFQSEREGPLNSYRYDYDTGTVLDGFSRIAIYVTFDDKTGKAADVYHADY